MAHQGPIKDLTEAIELFERYLPDLLMMKKEGASHLDLCRASGRIASLAGVVNRLVAEKNPDSEF